MPTGGFLNLASYQRLRFASVLPFAEADKLRLPSSSDWSIDLTYRLLSAGMGRELLEKIRALREADRINDAEMWGLLASATAEVK